MGWETRQRGGVYYVHKEWRNGRCVSVYRGGGETATLIALVDRYDTLARQEKREEWNALRERLRQEEMPVVALCRHVDGLVHQVLTNAGYYRPGRHPWRKKRMTIETALTTTQEDMQAAPALLAQAVTPAAKTDKNLTSKQRLALIKKARRGDEAAHKAMYVGVEPDKLRAYHISIAERQLDLPRALCGDDLMTAESFRVKIQQVRDDLGYATAPPLERLLMERIAACWFDVTLADVTYRNRQNAPDGLTMETGEFYEARRERAHKRYLSSIKALAEVRKLNLPDVNLNAIQTQVNVMGIQANRVQTAQE